MSGMTTHPNIPVSPATRGTNDARRHAASESVLSPGRSRLMPWDVAEGNARLQGGRAYWRAYAAEAKRTDPDRTGAVIERVVFTSTDVAGTVLRRYVDTSPHAGDLAGEWAVVRWDDGETTNVRAAQLTTYTRRRR